MCKNPLEVHYQNSFASIKIGNYLSEHLHPCSAIVCVGTDKCIVDSLGPLVGTMLSKNNLCIDVYGTLENPVHAVNLAEKLDEIKKHNHYNIIAIDACLSVKKSQGIIEIRKSPITPGKGIGKVLPEVGDVSIIGIVEKAGKEFHSLVRETRLSLIYDMAQVIADSIQIAIELNNLSGKYSDTEINISHCM